MLWHGDSLRGWKESWVTVTLCRITHQGRLRVQHVVGGTIWRVCKKLTVGIILPSHGKVHLMSLIWGLAHGSCAVHNLVHWLYVRVGHTNHVEKLWLKEGSVLCCLAREEALRGYLDSFLTLKAFIPCQLLLLLDLLVLFTDSFVVFVVELLNIATISTTTLWWVTCVFVLVGNTSL